MTLDELAINTPAVITQVGGEGELRLRLLDMGLTPRTAVRVKKVAPLGDPIEITVRGYSLSLRKDDARMITVRPADQPEGGTFGCAGCEGCGKGVGRHADCSGRKPKLR